MGDPAGRQRRLRRRDGGCAGSLPETARSRSPAVCRTNLQNQSSRPARRSPPNPNDPRVTMTRYERNGVADIFMMSRDWKAGAASRSPTATPPPITDGVEELSDTHLPSAEKIALVEENLSTHTAASLMRPFPWPRPADEQSGSNGITRPSMEVGSTWPNRTRRSDDTMPEPPHSRQAGPRREVAAWQDHRNKHHAKADWQFTTDDARVKLKRLYPHFE